jgi:Skp family chaperone for outer membrane proteins
MTKMFKAALLSAAAAAALTATPTMAQRGGNTAQPVPVVVVANTDAAVVNSNAYRVAVQQIQQTYGPQIQAAQARNTAIQAELQALRQTAITERDRQPRNEAAFRAAVTALQTREQAAEQEMQRLTAPIQLAQEYAAEQVSLRMAEAFEAARRARGATIVLRADAVLTADDAANITPAIVTELNRLVPNVQIVPPQGYQPGSLIRAAQQQAAAQQQGAAAPGTPAPTPAPATQPQTR